MSDEKQIKGSPIWYIRETGKKLREEIDPIIKRDCPHLSDHLVELIWSEFNGSVGSWYVVMTKFVLPHKNLIKSGIPLSVWKDENEQTWATIPDIFPGISLEGVPIETYHRVNKLLVFYLNLYSYIGKDELE